MAVSGTFSACPCGDNQVPYTSLPKSALTIRECVFFKIESTPTNLDPTLYKAYLRGSVGCLASREIRAQYRDKRTFTDSLKTMATPECSLSTNRPLGSSHRQLLRGSLSSLHLPGDLPEN